MPRCAPPIPCAQPNRRSSCASGFGGAHGRACAHNWMMAHATTSPEAPTNATTQPPNHEPAKPSCQHTCMPALHKSRRTPRRASLCRIYNRHTLSTGTETLKMRRSLAPHTDCNADAATPFVKVMSERWCGDTLLMHMRRHTCKSRLRHGTIPNAWIRNTRRLAEFTSPAYVQHATRKTHR